MVATGDPTPVCTKTEVIDLMDANNICETLGDYPLEMASGFGGLLNGNLPVLCGGFNPDIEGYVLRECYALTEVIYNRLIPFENSCCQIKFRYQPKVCALTEN